MRRDRTEVVAEYVDKYGDTRVIHKGRHGLRKKRTRSTPAMALNNVIGELIGEKIRDARIARGMSMEELCVRSGLSTATPKSRMWEIEKGVRPGSIKLGTLYAIALALDMDPAELLPSMDEVSECAGVDFCEAPRTLAIAGS